MLLWHALLFPFVPVLASRLCDSPYMIQAKADRDLREAISVVLESPFLLTVFSPVCLSILKAFHHQSPDASNHLFKYICNHFGSYRQEIRRRDPLFWHGLTDHHFYSFAQHNPASAQEVIDQIVVPNHPFWAELNGLITIDTFLQWHTQNHSQHQGLNDYVESTIGEIFKRKFNEIFTTTDPSHDAQRQLCILLEKYKQSVPYPDSESQEACEFLMCADVQYIRPVFRVLEGPGSMHSRVKKMASTAYRRLFLSKNPKPRPYQKMGARLRKLENAVICNIRGVPWERAGQDRSRLTMLLPQVDEASADESRTPVASKLYRNTDPDEVRPLVAEALQKGQVRAQMSPDVLAILRAFEQDSEICRDFFFFACQYFSTEEIAIKKDTDYFWNFFVNKPFITFAEVGKEQALAIVCQVVMPNHPLLSQCTDPALLSGAQAFFEEASDLTSFVEEASKKVFTERLLQILANTDRAERQLEIMLLIYDHEATFSWQLPRYKYAYAFLTELLLEKFETATAELERNYETLFDNPETFALQVYNKLAQNGDDDSRKVVSCLMRILATTQYECIFTGSYQEVIKTYAESGPEPKAGLKYLRSLIAEALQNPKMHDYLFPAYLSIMDLLQREQPSQAHLTFLCYTLQNYGRFWFEKERKKHYFWNSLMFSSLKKFEKTHPRQAQQILDSIPAPSVGRYQRSVPLEFELFVDFYEIGRATLDYAASRGHAASVELIVRSGQTLGDVQNKALKAAVSYGHVGIVEYLFHSGLLFSDAAMNYSLISAATHGYTMLVELMINTGYDFDGECRDVALIRAVRYKYTGTVVYLLNSSLIFTDETKQNIAREYSWFRDLITEP